MKGINVVVVVVVTEFPFLIVFVTISIPLPTSKSGLVVIVVDVDPSTEVKVFTEIPAAVVPMALVLESDGEVLEEVGFGNGGRHCPEYGGRGGPPGAQ